MLVARKEVYLPNIFLHDGFFDQLDIETARENAHNLFRILDEQLWGSAEQRQDRTCTSSYPTIADIVPRRTSCCQKRVLYRG